MAKPLKYLCVVLVSLFLFQIRTVASAKHGESTDSQVKALLGRMTLEEKVGQMTQLTIKTLSVSAGPQRGKVDMKKLEEAIVMYHVGSIFDVYDSAISADAWDKLITTVQHIAMKKTRLGIPVLYGIDAIHGATYAAGSTLFPQAINMAATFNTELVKREGEITALEVKACGIPWIFYPLMDLGRQPVWPRLYETFGEDPYLDSQMGTSYVEGAQGSDISASDKVAVCLKHYVGYSFPLDGMDRTPAWIPTRMMRQYFLPPFRAGVKAGASTVMVNSTEVNGIPCDANYHLLTQVLRNEMKFRGLVVSDWADIENLYTRYRVASSPEEAVRMAVMAGVDMSMVPSDYSFYNILLELVKDGKVPVSRIDQAVSRILWVKFKLGLFKNPYPDHELKKQFGSTSSDETNLEAAEESITLVKNEAHLLPLSKNTKVLVSGPTADKLSTMNGGWTITWQGDEESLYPKHKMTPLEAIRAKVGTNNVTYLPGCTYDSLTDLHAVVQAASGVDAVVLCLGEPAYAETPGNIDDLTLPDAQLKLAEALIATGKPVVLVMFEGRPRIINKLVGGSKAILIAFLPGMEGGKALANILFGDVNPSGRLPITYPRYVNALCHYDYDEAEVQGGNTFNPQWNFGYGLSYTSFEYGNLKLSRDRINEGEKIVVSVKVTNTGNMAGKEVVALYLGQKYRQVTHPVRQLEGFDKVLLQPGETKEVRFVITPEQMSFVGIGEKTIIQPGLFKVSIGNLSREFVVVGSRAKLVPGMGY